MKISDLENGLQGNVLQFPIAISPAQLLELETTETIFELTERVCEKNELDQYEGVMSFKDMMAGCFAPLPPKLSAMKCECPRRCGCEAAPTMIADVEAYLVDQKDGFKHLCYDCLDEHSKVIGRVYDSEQMSDAELLADFELRR